MNKYVYSLIVAFLIPMSGLLLVGPGENKEDLPPVFEKIQISNNFYGEGAAFGDINMDGKTDVVCGPFWYSGPDFKTRYSFYENPKPFHIYRYGDSNTLSVYDVNADGWNDILVVGARGGESYWYENPQRVEAGQASTSNSDTCTFCFGSHDTGQTFSPDSGDHTGWERHVIHPKTGNEAAGFYDLTGDGKPELLYNTDGHVEYAVINESDPTGLWRTTRVSSVQRDWPLFKHGIGLGDINGDGHNDILMSEGWWENPGPDGDGSLWRHHPADFGPNPMQMYAYDIDGDGLNDVVASLEAHRWGLAWYRQVRSNGEIHFEKNLIIGSELSDNPYGVRFSEPHAVALADLNRDGLDDIVTGKRYLAHGPTGDMEPLAPAVVYGFVLERHANGKAHFVPYLVDDNSGVGNAIKAGDMTGNGYGDIVTCNKMGAFVFLNQSNDKL
jgi:hypothetical protein